MTRESDEYEKFIASLIEHVKGAGRDIRNIGFGRHNKLTGKSGQPHQIDVSFIDYSYPDPTLVLIECKRWKEDIDVSVAKIIDWTLRDVIDNPIFPSHGKAIIVATAGFQGGTHRVAGFRNIITQRVNSNIPYGFRYENIVQEATMSECTIADHTEIEVKREGTRIDDNILN